MSIARFKDFDEFIQEPVSLRYKEVIVKSQSVEDSYTLANIRNKNYESISQYEIKDSTGHPKIPLGIFYQSIPVGEVTIWGIDKRSHSCMISYWVDKDFRRKKIGTYAVALVSDYCLSELNMEEVEAPVQEENTASKELLMKLSYTIAGYETFTGKDGIKRAHETYLLLKPENGIEFTLVDFLEMMAQPPEE